MIPRSFYFVRHGETDWNKESRLQGWTDIPLNPTGRSQAEKAAATISNLPVDLLVASPLIRAHQTAEILNAAWKKPVIIDPRLKERNFGMLEGMTVNDAEDWKKKVLKDNSRPIEENGYPLPDKAETYEAFKQRITSAIIEHLQNAENENVMFIAHGGIYRVLGRLLIGGVHMSPNVQPYHFEKTAQGWEVKAV